jgi:hypothetical protein
MAVTATEKMARCNEKIMKCGKMDEYNSKQRLRSRSKPSTNVATLPKFGSFKIPFFVHVLSKLFLKVLSFILLLHRFHNFLILYLKCAGFVLLN